MARLTPAEFAEKHGRRLKGAIEDIRRGIEKVSVSPTEEAIKKKDKMVARLNEAITTGKWERGLKRVSLEKWRELILNKGLQRIPAGIDSARDKVEAFASELLPHIDRGVESVKRMPDLTLEDSINRMTTFIRHMAQFRK